MKQRFSRKTAPGMQGKYMDRGFVMSREDGYEKNIACYSYP